MNLSNFQKDIVKNISQEHIKTVKDFLILYDLIELNERDNDFSFQTEYYKIIDQNDAYSKIVDFRKVINLLLKADLIELNETANLGFGYAVTNDLPENIINLISQVQTSFIVTYNELNKFSRDFRTPQERDQFWQRWIPIIVAIATVVLSSVLNYFIYTKEREVYIKNENAFKDSLYIKIINDLDSLKFYEIKQPDTTTSNVINK